MILKKVLPLLDKKQKRQIVWLVLMMLVGAALETASIALVLPVVAVVISPDAVATNKYASWAFNFLGFTNHKTFTIVVMTLLIAAFVVKNIYLFLQWKATYAFVYRNQFATSERLMKNYLRKNYEYYLFADTTVVQRNITSDVNNMYALILALLTLASESIVFLALVIVLVFVEPVMCIVIGVLLLTTMFVITKILKPVMHKAGEDNQNYYSLLFKWISQMVVGIKEVKIGNKEKYFIKEYKQCGNGYVNAVQRYSLYNNTPKLLIETVCVAGMIGYMLVKVLSGGDLSNDIPILGAFAVAAVKLMPSANKINNQLNAIAYCEPFFLEVRDRLLEGIEAENNDMTFAEQAPEKFDIKQSIFLKDIVYSYPKTDKLIFDHASMEIPLASAVGIVGTTGAGKTTVVDIMLGLLELQCGNVYVDDTDIKDVYKSWLKNVGYIPQMIYMLDTDIRHNVAFGVSDEDIDDNLVWAALKEAHLDEFVKGLPEGLNTKIGERGIRISGGQRQRIGIARALYSDPEVLIMDEATSALDNETEAAIMESINSLHGKKTLVIIAHRLQTIEKCDIIYRVADGKITRER